MRPSPTLVCARWASGTAPLLAALLALLLAAAGCDDRAERVAAKAKPALEELAPLVERDTKQVREGLPEGAALLATFLDDDPAADPEGLRRAISRARAAVKNLAFAKSTFFVFVDTEGVVRRSEGDPDLAAGHSLVKAVPEAKQFLEKDGLVELYGYMEGLRGVNEGPDLLWLVGHRVKAESGTSKGSFVTGWSLRRYAEYLENHLRRHLEATSDDKAKAIPLTYVFLVKGDKAYGGPVTPDIDAEEVAKLGLVDKTKAGPFQTFVTVEERRFAVAAAPCPQLGPDVVLAVMLSGV